jgi:ADP-heptose:LPS heptosyltransferase
MKRIAVGFSNGIGNLIILGDLFAPINRSDNFEIDLVIDEKWTGEVRDAIILIADNSSCIKRVVFFPSEFNRDNYYKVFMSYHNNMCGLYREIYGNQPDINKLESWSESFLSERMYYYDEFYRLLGVKGKLRSFEMPYDYKTYKEAKNHKIIVISNGYLKIDDNSFDRKSYPHWKEVIERLNKFYPEYGIVLVGGSTDVEWADEVYNCFPKVVNTVGRLSILESAAFIRASKLFLTTDTGVMHIGDSFSIPMITLFGPTLVSKNGPKNGATVLRSPLSCAPCQGTIFWRMCKSSESCMSAIDPSLVMAAVRKFI